jgi:hypothetical protein
MTLVGLPMSLRTTRPQPRDPMEVSNAAERPKMVRMEGGESEWLLGRRGHGEES